jgi:hypothetical protein
VGLRYDQPSCNEDRKVNVTLVWQKAALAESYHMQVSTAADFSENINITDPQATVGSDIGNNEIGYTATGLESGKTFWWKVVSHKGTFSSHRESTPAVPDGQYATFSKSCLPPATPGATGITLPIHDTSITIANPVNVPNYQTVVDRAKQAGYNPAFIVTIWLAESNAGRISYASQFGCIYVTNTFDAQLNCVLNNYQNANSMDTFWANHCGPGFTPICNGDGNQGYPGLWLSIYQNLTGGGGRSGSLNNPWACWWANASTFSNNNIKYVGIGGVTHPDGIIPRNPSDPFYQICPF